MIATTRLSKIEKLVVSTLKDSDTGLTLAEIAERTGESKKRVFKALRKLFEKDMINTGNRAYRLSSS